MIALIITVFVFFVSLEDNDDDAKSFRKGLLRAWRTLIPVVLFTWLGCILIPSSSTIAMMVVIPKIAESKAIQQDLPDIYELAIKTLKDELQKK